MEPTLVERYDEAAATRETDELLVEVERLKVENADDPLLSEAIEISERELADGDEIIANTRQTSDGFRQAATCILGGVD